MCEEDKLLVAEFKTECKEKHYRCSNACSAWDSKDRECEFYGDRHPGYSSCARAFVRWKERRK